MSYFLAKSDPSDYSLTDFQREKITPWDGVHNYQAINVIKSWEVGDYVLFYHSQGEARIMALGKVVTQPRENKEDPRYSWVADIEYVHEFPDEQKIYRKEIVSSGLFDDFYLVRNPRLSVMPVPENVIEWLRGKGLDLPTS